MTTQQQSLQDLHVSTCVLMTRFINGHHCPKLAHLIVQKLNQLLSYAHEEQNSNHHAMYAELLEHWQKVTEQLLEQQKNQSKTAIRYH